MKRSDSPRVKLSQLPKKSQSSKKLEPEYVLTRVRFAALAAATSERSVVAERVAFIIQGEPSGQRRKNNKSRCADEMKD